MEEGAVSKRKTYCCVVKTDRDITKEELTTKLDPLLEVEVDQDTPVR